MRRAIIFSSVSAARINNLAPVALCKEVDQEKCDGLGEHIGGSAEIARIHRGGTSAAGCSRKRRERLI
jgi:hypothetical protein